MPHFMQTVMLLGWQVCLGAACEFWWAAEQQECSSVQSPDQMLLLQCCSDRKACLRICKQPTCQMQMVIQLSCTQPDPLSRPSLRILPHAMHARCQTNCTLCPACW